MDKPLKALVAVEQVIERTSRPRIHLAPDPGPCGEAPVAHRWSRYTIGPVGRHVMRSRECLDCGYFSGVMA